MIAVFKAYAANLRSDAVLQKLLAWELAAPSDTLRWSAPTASTPPEACSTKFLHSSEH